MKRAPRKRALLVGINTYAMPGANLRGCVNDVLDLAELLINVYGFERCNVRLLLNERATTAAISERLEWLRDGVMPVDKLFHGYSGHGAQDATRNPAGEIDGLDEVICPFDFDWSPEKMIRDKDYVELFKDIPAGVPFNWLSDSCHSGDLTRAMTSNQTPRSFPMPEDVLWHIAAAKAKGLKPQPAAIELNVGYLSGCKSNQTSADTEIDGRPCGAMVSHFIKAIKADPNRPLDFIAADIRRQLAEADYSQRPQAEGLQRTQPVLGGLLK